ncbi:MAG: TIGR01777 family oxidoreductase [Verrucomicrobiales bacterium]|nr:TIGR01777 family oxidoreductase [Verrucomicrobiae bacterium]MCP5554154.1 TIGR01777 family protein [Akkermansiaceae bacterium]
MKIVLPGGSGQVGTLLARDFHARGHDVTVLSRRPGPAPWRTLAWNGESAGAWWQVVDGADVVINLAGRSVNCRYHDRNREEILHSRIASTRAVGEAIAAAGKPPAVWLQAGTATIYAEREDADNDEETGQIDGLGKGRWGFSTEVALRWEAALANAPTPQTRKVTLRSAMTMSPDRGGVFDVLLGLVRRGLGGRAGTGRQYVSWIHDQDFIRAVDWIIGHPFLEGPVNLAAPVPLPNAEFMRALRAAWGRRVGLPATAGMLEVGAFFLGTETELILKSRRVVPARLLQSGFTFLFPEWPAAARELCDRWRRPFRAPLPLFDSTTPSPTPSTKT